MIASDSFVKYFVRFFLFSSGYTLIPCFILFLFSFSPPQKTHLSTQTAFFTVCQRKFRAVERSHVSSNAQSQPRSTRRTVSGRFKSIVRFKDGFKFFFRNARSVIPNLNDDSLRVLLQNNLCFSSIFIGVGNQVLKATAQAQRSRADNHRLFFTDSFTLQLNLAAHIGRIINQTLQKRHEFKSNRFFLGGQTPRKFQPLHDD